VLQQRAVDDDAPDLPPVTHESDEKKEEFTKFEQHLMPNMDQT
jgi:hypothetical protein